MIRDLLRFVRHVFEILRFIRGVILASLLLLICVAVFVFAEGLPIGQAVYLVLITALTIGYGDVTPETALGQTVSVVTGVIGILITGIVVAVVVRALSEAVREKLKEQNAKE